MWRTMVAVTVFVMATSAYGQIERRPRTRADRIRDFEMDRLTSTLNNDEYRRPAAEVLDEFFKEDDRRMLDGLARVLRYKTLSSDQILRLISAAQQETSEAKKVFLWVALFDAQSSVARDFLEKTLTAQTDEGLTVQFLQSLHILRGAEVPLLTRLYDQHSSELVQDEIVRFATNQDRTHRNERDEPDHLQAPARAALMGWLMRHAHNPAHRARVISVYYWVAGGGPAAMQELRDFFDQEKSSEARKTAFESLLKTIPSEEVLRLLFLRESDPGVQLAGLKVLEANMTTRESAAHMLDGSVRVIKEALSADISPAVKDRLKLMLEASRKRAVQDAVELARQSMEQGYSLPEGIPADMRRRSLERLREPVGPTADSLINSLKRTYGELPEEPAVRDELTKIQVQKQAKRDEFLRREGLATQPGADGR